jgi:2-keto-3-deoxy-L-arabinonate dehydratase
MNNKLKGIMPAICTACNDRGEVDEANQRRLVRFCIEKGVHGLAPSVMGGEFYKFTEDERKKVIDIVIDEANGKVPVVAGTSHSGTLPSVMLSKYAEDAGADAVIVMPPYFNRAESALCLYNHYRAIANAVSIPIMLQDAEDDIQIHLCATLVSQLALEFSNIEYVKIEGRLTIPKIREIRELTSSRMRIFGGDGGVRMLQEFQEGTEGCIPGTAMSELCVDIFDNLERGRIETAREQHEKLLIFLRFCSSNALSVNEIEKEALRLLGAMDATHVRGPAVPLPHGYELEIKRILQKIGLMPSVDARLS